MIDEIASTIEHLRSELEALAVRGIRAAGPDRAAILRAAGEEFERIGAEHMAARIADVVAALEHGDRRAAAALLRAQTSLRLFERVLTLDVARAALAALVEAACVAKVGPACRAGRKGRNDVARETSPARQAGPTADEALDA